MTEDVRSRGIAEGSEVRRATIAVALGAAVGVVLGFLLRRDDREEH